MQRTQLTTACHLRGAAVASAWLLFVLSLQLHTSLYGNRTVFLSVLRCCKSLITAFFQILPIVCILSWKGATPILSHFLMTSGLPACVAADLIKQDVKWSDWLLWWLVPDKRFFMYFIYNSQGIWAHSQMGAYNFNHRVIHGHLTHCPKGIMHIMLCLVIQNLVY